MEIDWKIVQDKDAGEAINILTDSQAFVKALKTHDVSSKSVSAVRDILNNKGASKCPLDQSSQRLLW